MRELTCIPGVPLPERLIGVGWNWFDHLGAGGHYARYSGYPLDAVVHPEPGTTAWTALLHRLDEMRPGLLRFGIPADLHCDPAGRFRGGTASWRRLAALDRWAQGAGASIILDPFVVPRPHELPVPAGTGDPGDRPVNMAPRDPAAYARAFVAPMLRQAVDEGMDAVRWFNPVNEPNEYGVWQVPAGHPLSAWAAYVETLRAIRAACDDAGVPRTRVGLLGLDSSSNVYPLLDLFAEGLDPDPWIDGYSRHYYSLRLDHLPPVDGSWTTPMADSLDRGTAQLVRYARARGKPVVASEIGTFHYGWRLGDPAGAASREAVLTVAEGIIRALATGVAGACVWSLFNPDVIDGHWAALRVQAEDVVPAGRAWDVYGMLVAVCRPGAKIIPLRCEPATVLPYAHAILIAGPAGLALAAVNDHAEAPLRLRVRLPPDAGDARWTAQVCDHERRAAPAVVDAGMLIVDLPPLSLAVATRADT